MVIETDLEIKELFQRLVETIENSNTFPSFNTVLSLLALIAPVITIIVLLLEHYEKRRPYLQISFELVRSTLACVVLRNTGNSPLVIKSLKFSDDFIRQLREDTQERLKSKDETNIIIFPNRKWVMSFDISVSEIITEFKEKKVKICYTYSKIGKHLKRYNEDVMIDFEDYSGMIDYISDLDEFKRSTAKLEESVKRLIEVRTLEEDYLRRICEKIE